MFSYNLCIFFLKKKIEKVTCVFLGPKFDYEFKLHICCLLILTGNTVVSLALICSFKRMKEHLNLGNVKAEDIPEDTLKAVAETLRKSSSLKLSEDGELL